MEHHVSSLPPLSGCHMMVYIKQLIYVLSTHISVMKLYKVKGKAIPVTDRGGSYGCETSRLPHFL
jgi:hypothetical protein